ncbi:MAG: hypothetical protein COA49_03360 [Bacteroidetes bacterium]|nr:MAG: hypothetical protein COA49_03360 [Bacteroidota bacterium]
MPQNIDFFLDYSKDLVSVESSASLKKVYTIMYTKQVSYVPIINHNRKVNVGVYRRKTLFKWFILNQGKSIDEIPKNRFQEPPLPEADICTTLEDTMVAVKTKKAMLVKIDNKYSKIITPRVIADALEVYSARFMIFENLELAIRNRILESNNILNEIDCTGLNKSIPVKPEDLEFGQYVTVLSQKWNELGLGSLDKQRGIKLLNSALQYRNRLMHFKKAKENDNGLEAAKELTEFFKS